MRIHLIPILGFILMTSALAACGQRQPAESPAQPTAPPESPRTAPAAPSPDPAAAPAPVHAVPEYLARPEPAGTTPESPFHDAPLTAEQRDEVWPRSDLNDPAALYTEWRGVIDNPHEPSRVLRLQMLGRALAPLGVEACQPLFDVMADESEDPMTRYLVVVTLEDWVVPPFLEVLEPLVSADQDDITRGYAVYLIGRLNAPEAIPVLERLANDDDPRVRFGAQLGLAELHQPEYEQALLEAFRDEDSPSPERASIAILFAERNDPLLTDFYLEAAADPDLPIDARRFCLQALSVLADPSTVPELEAIAQNPDLADLRIAAEYALQTIELHETGAMQPFPDIQ